MAATAFRSTEDVATLIPRLQRWLPPHWEVCELHGLVYVERVSASREEVRTAVAGALRTIYGDDWREHVDGFDDWVPG